MRTIEFFYCIKALNYISAILCFTVNIQAYRPHNAVHLHGAGSGRVWILKKWPTANSAFVWADLVNSGADKYANVDLSLAQYGNCRTSYSRLSRADDAVCDVSEMLHGNKKHNISRPRPQTINSPIESVLFWRAQCRDVSTNVRSQIETMIDDLTFCVSVTPVQMICSSRFSNVKALPQSTSQYFTVNQSSRLFVICRRRGYWPMWLNHCTINSMKFL